MVNANNLKRIIPQGTKTLVILMGIGLLVSLFFQVRPFFSKNRKEDLWGEYWKTRMALEYAQAQQDSTTTQYWAKQNQRIFDVLKSSKLILPIYFSEWEDFRKTVLVEPRTYRGGWALMGGQWPAKIEYVDELTYPDISDKFKTTQAFHQEHTFEIQRSATRAQIFDR